MPESSVKSFGLGLLRLGLWITGLSLLLFGFLIGLIELGYLPMSFHDGVQTLVLLLVYFAFFVFGLPSLPLGSVLVVGCRLLERTRSAQVRK